MHSIIFLGCAALALAQSSNVTTTIASSSTSSVSKTTSTSASILTVAQDGSGQFTAINPAISFAQNSGYPTVTVKAGTYSETVSVVATQTVTIIGENASPSDYTQNKVTISNSSGPVTIGSNSVQGISWRNMNFVNGATTGTTYAVSLRGTKNAFYDCSFVSAGAGVITSTLGITLISGGYVEGTDKVFYSYPGMYVYGTTIVATSSSALLVYSKGATVSNVFYNSTVVFDSCSLVQKSSSTNTGVYLAAPNNVGSQAVYRNTSMAAFIAAAGVHPSASTYTDYYGEFDTTGAGSYSSNSASRSSYDHLLTADQMSAWSIASVFANSFPPYATTDLTWIDSKVLQAIQSAEIAQTSAISSSSAASSTVSSSTASASLSSAASASATGSSTVSTVTSSSSASATSAACTASATFAVSLSPSGCEYANVSAAIAALPNDSQAKTIQIKAGTYTEQLSITRNGKVTLVGETNFTNDYTQNKVTIQFSNGQLTSAGEDESTPILYAKKSNDNSGLAVYNIDFVNTYPQTKNTAALAADFYGNEIAAYGCSFVGFQDTLLANKGTQVFSNSYIEGSIDFIWGYSTAYFHQCYIAINTAGACISAQSRSTSTSAGGYVFDSCYITGTSTYGSTMGLSYLGRPYSNFSIAVYMNSYIDSQINSAGWSVWQTSNPQTNGVLFGEYNNSGPSSWQANTQRASFATNLTQAQAESYSLSSWIGDTSWLDTTAYDYVPSYALSGASTTTSGSTSTSSGSATATSSGVTSTATINAHPDSGTVPPTGAVLVSPNGEVNGSYSNLTAALASLPNDSTNQTIFIYSGTYTEQVPDINRAGALRIIGYTTAAPGLSYLNNTVTITYARGLSVSPLPTGHSDAETATVSTASNRISWYNVNIINSDNLDGLESSYVTLAASIYGNDIGFYAVSMVGWQDTLLTGATTGYQYYESSYIEGAIDFIWGYSKAYFKGCTIAAKRASSAMTAQSRASSSAIGGYIFDECLFTAASDATVDLTQSVYLGRPYSEYALVVVKNSYLDDCIEPSGWKVWSTTDPRTDYITFAEYNNEGPGAWQSNVAAREAFQNCTLLTSDTYPLSSVMDSTSWIDMTYFDSISTPQPAVASTSTGTNITVSGNSTYDGTTPAAGAFVVSKTAISGLTTYDTIQSALNAMPTSSKTNATIFIYPGTYEEQLVVNKSGTTIFQGYSNSTDDYTQNQVIITYSYGVDTQSDESNSDSATVYATGNYFYAYNINFRNDNGTAQDIASLGFAVKSSKYASLYACQVYGNQDTLLINGYLFAFKSYIEGNIDFIWGSGAGYFLSSTIAPNEDDINITADKRATNTTEAGFVFDQCTIEPAAGYSGFKSVSLGRPWNDLARVAYVDCYLDSMIEAAGWNEWSKTSPQTDAVTFAEYHNYGPGSSVCSRANFSEQLTDDDVTQFQLGNFFTTTTWINFTAIDVQPFTAGIGSAPAACASSSSTVSVVSSTSTVLSSTSTSSSVLTTSSSSSSVLPTTLYVTKTTTEKETLTTSYTSADVTSVSTVVVTEDDGLTVTPSPSTKTTTEKDSTTILSTTTVAGKTSTIKATTIISSVDTVTPAPTTVTDNEGSTTTVTAYSTPKASTVSSKTTITLAPSATKTTTAKGSTTTVTTTSVKLTTKTASTTITCVPTAGSKARRVALVERAAGGVTITSTTTFVTYVKTTSIGEPGSTEYATVTSTSTIGEQTTLKAATSTVTLTSLAVKTSVITESEAAETVESIKTSSVFQTVTAAKQTITVVDEAVTTQTVTSVLAPSTTTVYETVTSSEKSVTVTVTAAPSTKTTTVKSTSTVYTTSTKTSKGAAACTA
ncbi:hypothetical protein LTR85_004878 [Meristemomyces frigidus]|nr:hypothetical protein LTR85_004878 [Meristemomyces frigidus]